MTASPDGWPYGQQAPWSQQDRDLLRDRVRDCEHAIMTQGDRLTGLEGFRSQTRTELGWHKAALGLLAWAFLNTKLAVWTPELAALVAAVLKGLAR
jgi:hypothetical protein